MDDLTLPKLDPTLDVLFQKDRMALAHTELPMVTVAGTVREDLKGFYGLPDNNTTPDIVFSRAHYSMPVGVAIQVWGKEPQVNKAWVIDPTNYVSASEWKKITFTHVVGKTLARNTWLKKIKDLVDQFGRQKLPILKSISGPLAYLTHDVTKPILSFHIAAGNLLVEQGKKVVQVITDPHVRDEYLAHVDTGLMTYCVFDARTQYEVFEKAFMRGVKLTPKQVVVTGPPIDPRIVHSRKNKKAWDGGTLRIVLATGGLGTNKEEIKTVLQQLLPALADKDSLYQLTVYAGTQLDIATMVQKMAAKHKVKIDKNNNEEARLRLLYHPQLVDANELLVMYGFPWSDVFISKPSGDMAYDAAASGSALLTLSEWGEWEHNVRSVFEQKGVAQKLDVDHALKDLEALKANPNLSAKNRSWIHEAQEAALSLEPLFLEGAKNIVKVAQSA
jgi:hypothetical protein